MSDDIVTLLREADGKVLPDFYCNNLRFRACYEIERLRTEIERLGAEIKRQDAEILDINLLWNADKAQLEALRDAL